MVRRNRLLLSVGFMFCSVLLFFGVGAVAAIDCSVEALTAAGFKDVKFGKPIVFSFAAVVSESSSTPEHCYVKATVWPETDFEIKLPVSISWNGRLYYNGGGGWDGSIPDLSAGLNLRCASAGTNGGHRSFYPPGLQFLDGSFGWPIAENPNALQKREDFGYRAAYEGSILAKKVIEAYYGSGPAYSYWVGCSNGGRGAMMMSQRYPEVFDGYVAGAPHYSYMGTTMRGIWDSQVTAGIQDPAEAFVPLNITDPAVYSQYAAAKMNTLANAVYSKCDSVDGLVDGLIDDPTECSFNAAVELPLCADDVDSPTCFTKGQIKGLKKIYGGVRDSAGKLLYPGTALGAEVVAPGLFGVTPLWFGNVVAMSPGAAADALAPPMYQYIAFNPAPGPS